MYVYIHVHGNTAAALRDREVYTCNIHVAPALMNMRRHNKNVVLFLVVESSAVLLGMHGCCALVNRMNASTFVCEGARVNSSLCVVRLNSTALALEICATT